MTAFRACWMLVFGALLSAALLYMPQAAPPLSAVPRHYEERLIALDRETIETAYKQQITSLFLTWMKDETGQPQRATRGAEQAKRAYVRSMDALAQRAAELERQ